MATLIIQLDPKSIKIGTRTRKDLGDIAGLAASIKAVGLLHPITVTPDHELIVGARRLQAIKLLKRRTVPAVVDDNLSDFDKRLKAENDENTCRKDFSPTEAVAMGKRIEELVKPIAKAKQSAAGGAKPHGQTLPKRPRNEFNRTESRAAKAVGMSRETYRKAKRVASAAEDNPKEFGDLPVQMDATGKVDAAHRAMEARKNGEIQRKPKAPRTGSKTIRLDSDLVKNIRKAIKAVDKQTSKNWSYVSPVTLRDDVKLLRDLLSKLIGE